ncbi:MAG: CgeB family protein [Agriterribacter sp.]
MQTANKKYRIFQVIPDGGTILSANNKSSIWKKNLYQSLVNIGHDVVLLDFYYDDFFVHAENQGWLKERRKIFTQKIYDQFIAEHTKKKLDLCFFYLCDDFIDLDLVREIKDKNVPVFNYSCNNIHQFHLVEQISKLVDYAVYTEREAKISFNKIGANAVHMQMAANPDLYYPRKTPHIHDVTFIGQRYADRGYAIAHLIKKGIDVRAFGPRWDVNGEKVGNHTLSEKLDKLYSIIKREGLISGMKVFASKVAEGRKINEENEILKNNVGPVLSDDEMVALFSKSKINLGFSNVYLNGRDKSKVMSHVRLRDFEIPMCGAFYLTGFTDEIEEYFEIGKEIETFKNVEELSDKCTFYLKNDTLRTKIAENAYQRSITCHTWENRFNELFAAVPIN